jgi:transcriptional regulator with XRE-family HTH domain
MIDFIKVGQNITMHRKAAHFTQAQLAAKLFVTRQALSKWELGLGIPSLDSLLELCILFSITFEELLGLNDEKELSIEPHNLFQGRDRNYVIHQLIHQQIKIPIPEIIDQCTPYERMALLKAVKDKRLPCNLFDLMPMLTTSEYTFMKEHKKGGKRK